MKEQREQFFSNVVNPNGYLHASQIRGRQSLYTGRNGRVIERFWVELGGQQESYIFKPLTNGSTCGREKWIYEQLLDTVPVRVPRLYATAEHEDPGRYWAIYEDMGELSHHLKDSDYDIAAASIPLWHRLPLERVPEHFGGDKPELADMIQEISNGYDNMENRLLTLGLGVEQVAAIKEVIRGLNGSFETEIVISHGDYHQGNVCRREDEIIILDWEFVHHNSVYWDLYCLFDMSHPDFPKMISSTTRLAALHAYVNRRASFGWEANSDTFVANYHRYAIVHSLWMLGLIENDLQKGQWEAAKLRRAQQETIHSLVACLSYC